MGETRQPLECLDAIYSFARSSCVDLEPGVDWALGVGPDCVGHFLGMD